MNDPDKTKNESISSMSNTSTEQTVDLARTKVQNQMAEYRMRMSQRSSNKTPIENTEPEVTGVKSPNNPFRDEEPPKEVNMAASQKQKLLTDQQFERPSWYEEKRGMTTTSEYMPPDLAFSPPTNVSPKNGGLDINATSYAHSSGLPEPALLQERASLVNV